MLIAPCISPIIMAIPAIALWVFIEVLNFPVISAYPIVAARNKRTIVKMPSQLVNGSPMISV